ncbi:protein PIGBOS1 isoform 1-T2 [Rhinophrynus dorsalis]
MMFRRLSLPQLFLATILGVAGGVYIYKPIFEQYMWDQKKLKDHVQSVEAVDKKE